MGFLNWFKEKVTKEDIKKELNKISKASKERDKRIIELEALPEQIKNNSERIIELELRIISKQEIEDLIKEIISEVQSEPNSEPKSEPFIKQVVKRAIKTRPEVIKTAIFTLIDKDLKTTNIFNTIVNEKKLCGKTQFYHYLSLVRNELRTEVRTEPRIKDK